MREIKFRVWDKQEKRWLEDWVIAEPAGEMGWTIGVDHNPYFKNRWAVMQYTGLKDKNGVDIYEGDVVEAFQGIDQERCVVGWRDDLCGFAPYAAPNSAGYYKWRDYNTGEPFGEVIGNIYENPELVECESASN